ncbi:MAG: DMT family transporter [Candidatus Eremiobacteraeota bacterium]|nr:DMT family transporter [Candidatus Eremiobacteraeota bacterium]
MILSAVLWGAGWPALKFLSRGTPALHVMFLELAAASIFALTVVLVRSDGVKNWQRIRIAAAIGLIEPGAAYLLFAIGVSYTTASSATIIDALQPLVILLLATSIFGERFAPVLIALIVGALAGTALAIGFPLAGRQQAVLFGDALVGLGMMLAAFHSVLMKRVVAEVEPFVVTAVQQTVGAVMVGAAVVWTSGFRTTLSLSAYDLAQIALAGVVTIALPFVLYITAVRVISGASAGVAIAFIPVSGLTFSAIMLGEKLSLVQVAGAGITIGALFLAARVDREAQYFPR